MKPPPNIKHGIAALPAAVREWLNGRTPDEVECVVPDIVGIGRGKAMPARKYFRADTMYIPSSIFYQTITGNYAEVSLPNGWTEADLMLKADPSTARAVPWTSDVTIQVIHDLAHHNGKPAGFAPRNVLKRVLRLYEQKGWMPMVAPEMEFYLTKPNVNPDYPVMPPVGRTGRQGVSRQAYSISGVDEYEKVVDDIYDFAEAQGLEIDTIMQEGGAGQLEINLNHGNALDLADQVFMFKRTIREAALRNDCYATFMAKPMEEQPGSAMHIHQSVLDTTTGDNIFNDGGKESEAFLHFIGGQQQHLTSVMCILAPYVNSYRRLIPDESAPINVEWGYDNRSTGIRIPNSQAESLRVETRVAGMDCNPYLALAAVLACGYLGMVNRIKPRAQVKKEAYELPHELPRTVLEALTIFNTNGEIQEILGKHFSNIYSAVKRDESAEYLNVISPWEREHLLLNV